MRQGRDSSEQVKHLREGMMMIAELWVIQGWFKRLRYCEVLNSYLPHGPLANRGP